MSKLILLKYEEKLTNTILFQSPEFCFLGICNKFGGNNDKSTEETDPTPAPVQKSATPSPSKKSKRQRQSSKFLDKLFKGILEANNNATRLNKLNNQVSSLTLHCHLL